MLSSSNLPDTKLADASFPKNHINYSRTVQIEADIPNFVFEIHFY